MKQFNQNDILGWDKKYRIRFINSISGYKSAHLIGTQSSAGLANLALFNSIVHIGADPPLLGFVMRPLTVPRHTYSNIMATQHYTINHVHKSFVRQAHFTSGSFAVEESEFDRCKLTPEMKENFPAPFVGESTIKMGLQFREDIPIRANGTRLIVGEIQFILLDESIIESDGQLNLEAAHDVCVTGLNQYSSVTKFKKLPPVSVESLPDFTMKERPDNVVFDQATQSYNASLLPYGTNLGAPQIRETGLSAWKNSGVTQFNHAFNNKIESLKGTYQQLIEEYQLNEMLYQAKINFEPIIGQVYHLYSGKDQDVKFLSLVPPTEWKMEYFGSFKLNHDKVWQRVGNAENG